MDTLTLKLILTPTLIGAASLAGRRWGPSVSGWLVGLPFTSGPIAFFLTLAQGTTFGTSAALGTLAGAISQAMFCLGYGWTATRLGWGRALLVGLLVYAVATAILQIGLESITLIPMYGLVLLVLAISLRLLRAPTLPVNTTRSALPVWDLPARMIVATIFVIALTGISPLLGSHLSGLLAPFPMFAAILTVFAHHQLGAPSAIRVLRGLLMGLFAFAAFYLILSITLIPWGIFPAFMLAIVAALSVQGFSLWLLNRAKR